MHHKKIRVGEHEFDSCKIASELEELDNFLEGGPLPSGWKESQFNLHPELVDMDKGEYDL